MVAHYSFFQQWFSGDPGRLSQVDACRNFFRDNIGDVTNFRSHPAPNFPSYPVADDYRTWIEVDLGALRYNCRVAQACLRDAALPGIIAVVKADGYGLGMIRVAHAIADLVRAFAVANVCEAQELRRSGLEQPIYILGPALPGEWQAVAEGGFCPAVSTPAEVAGYAGAARRIGRPLAVQAVVDIGMGRIGALPADALDLVEMILHQPDLRLDSAASHFPSADENPTATREQAARCAELWSAMEAAGMPVAHTHLANSAGLMAYPQPENASGRAGLMLYGVSPMPEEQNRLQGVLTWKTRVTLVRTLPEGHGVSYGSTWQTHRATRIATLAVGYADGFPRQASGQGAAVLLGGLRCPLLGRVTMDQIMVDTTDLPAAPQSGDEVVLVGCQGASEITATELAEWGGTIAWDLFTGLGPRVKRCYSTLMD